MFGGVNGGIGVVVDGFGDCEVAWSVSGDYCGMDRKFVVTYRVLREDSGCRVAAALFTDS